MASAAIVLTQDELNAMLDRVATLAVKRALEQHTAPAREWMTADEVAEELGYRRRSIAGLVRKRGLPCHPIGRKLRFLRAEVDAWIREHGSK